MEYGHVPYDYAHMFQEDVPNSIKWLQNDHFLEYFNVIGTVRTSQSCRSQIFICCLNRKSNTGDIRENTDDYTHKLQNGYFSEACNFRNLANLDFRKSLIFRIRRCRIITNSNKSKFSRKANAKVLSSSTQFSAAGVFAKQHYHYVNENRSCCHYRTGYEYMAVVP